MKWQREFMNCYAGVGIKSYIAFKEFYLKFEFAPSIALAIAINKSIGGSLARGGNTPTSFNRGEFVFKDVLGAEDRAAKLMMLKEFYYGYKNKLFVYAMIRLFKFKDYNHSNRHLASFVMIKMNTKTPCLEKGNLLLFTLNHMLRTKKWQ